MEEKSLPSYEELLDLTRSEFDYHQAVFSELKYSTRAIIELSQRALSLTEREEDCLEAILKSNKEVARLVEGRMRMLKDVFNLTTEIPFHFN